MPTPSQWCLPGSGTPKSIQTRGCVPAVCSQHIQAVQTWSMSVFYADLNSEQRLLGRWWYTPSLWVFIHYEGLGTRSLNFNLMKEGMFCDWKEKFYYGQRVRCGPMLQCEFGFVFWNLALYLTILLFAQKVCIMEAFSQVNVGAINPLYSIFLIFSLNFLCINYFFVVGNTFSCMAFFLR